jgi:hypothetical protein
MRRCGFILLLSLALLAGCGDDEKKGAKPADGATTAEPPKAKQSLQVAAQELSETVASGSDCAKMFERMNPASLRGTTVAPGSPPQPGECERNKPLFDQLAGFKPTKAKELGPVGIVEGTADPVKPPHVSAGTWVVDQDGEWRLVLAGDFDRQIGVKPLPSSNFDEVAQQFVVAAQKGDCHKFFQLLGPFSGPIVATQNDEVKLCNTVSESYRKPTSALHDLASDPSAKPEKLGETLDFAWYAVKTKSGRYWVVILTTASEGDVPRELAKGHSGKVAVAAYVTLAKPPAP